MKYSILVLLFLTTFLSTNAQLSTFPINGVDDHRERMYAFVNAHIVIDAHTVIEDGVMLIKDGRIEYAGKSTEVPPSYVAYDLNGSFVYPSFVELVSSYGLKKEKQKRNNKPQFISDEKGAFGWNEAIRSEYQAYDHFIMNDTAAGKLRKLGFGAAVVHRNDGIARGSGVLVSLGKGKENEVILNDRAASFLSFKKGSSSQDYPSSLMGSIALIRQSYYDGIWYASDADKKEYNITLESWNTNLSLPQVFIAGDKLNILRASRIAKEFDVSYVIQGNGTEYQRLDAIKETNSTIITTMKFPKPYDVEDPYAARWVSFKELKHWELAAANMALMDQEGIPFVISSEGLNSKTFLKNLQKAVKYGLSEETALASLTSIPATVIGEEADLGSLEAGKIANFIITSKSIFEKDVVIYQNWIQGKPYIVTAYDFIDSRAVYSLSVKELEQPIRLKLNGKANAVKASIQIGPDSIWHKASYKRIGKQVTISFLENSNGYLRLSGEYDAKARTFDGSGQDKDGNWIKWSGAFVEEIKIKPKVATEKETFSKDDIIYPFQAYGTSEIRTEDEYLISNATIWTNEEDGVIEGMDIIIKDGKVDKIGKGLNSGSAKKIDGTGKHVTCGIIDEHSHIGINGGVNEGTQSSSSEVRIGDVINSENVHFYRQLAGGVTSAQLLHGSANPIGGQSAIIKFRWGATPEEFKISDASGYIKFALGENVKQSNWGDRNTVRYPQTRMGVEQTFYNYFIKAREYGENIGDESSITRRDLELDALLEILNAERFITCHSYVQSEINMLMHVADSMGFRMNTFTHILEGYKVADKMKAHGVAASTFSDWWAYKYEVIDAIPYNAAILNEVGVLTAINSDDSEMGRRLNQEAAKSVKYGGMSEVDAWKMVTLNPAKMLRIDHRVGSLKEGKDADVVVWSDNPLSIYAIVEHTFVDGIKYYDQQIDKSNRQYIKEERARLIQEMLKAKKSGAKTQKAVKKDNENYSCGHDHKSENHD